MNHKNFIFSIILFFKLLNFIYLLPSVFENQDALISPALRKEKSLFKPLTAQSKSGLLDSYYEPRPDSYKDRSGSGNSFGRSHSSGSYGHGQRDCGHPKSVPTIVGGFPANTRETGPFYRVGSSLTNPPGERVTLFCGGSLITLSLVLTAGHCLFPPRSGFIFAWKPTSGELNLEDLLFASSYKVHPNFDPGSNRNDIALIFLKQPVEVNPYDSTFCLYTSTSLPSSVLAVGYGKTDEFGSGSPTLLETSLSSVNCSSYSFTKNVNTELQFCLYTEGRDTCRGDSGGPVICFEQGLLYLCGIVSFGHGCARTGYPGVYTRVSSYVSWIKSYM